MITLATPVAGLVLMVTLQKVEEWLLGRDVPKIRRGGRSHG